MAQNYYKNCRYASFFVTFCIFENLFYIFHLLPYLNAKKTTKILIYQKFVVILHDFSLTIYGLWL